LMACGPRSASRWAAILQISKAASG
jgi:hypothetical protein